MKGTRQHIVPILAAGIILLAAPALAGGWFGLHIGSGGFGVSMGFSTWEPYTSAWDDPSWSLDFTTALAPYGSWVTVAGLGTVWRPAVAPGWRPYTWGRWVWTSYGWTWVSYEPWGYIPHHFGHWAYCSTGWVWAPGYVYTPAAVTWYAGGPMVGWCPAPPPGWHHAWAYDRGYRRGFDHGYRHGYGDGYRDGWADARHATWVSWNDLPSENVADRARGWRDVERRAGGTLPRPLANGPEKDRVERWTGRPVPTARVAERTVSIGGRQVRVARPEGVERSIERHAGRTVEHALDRTLARRIESRVPARSRTAATARRTSDGSRRVTAVERNRYRNISRQGPDSATRSVTGNRSGGTVFRTTTRSRTARSATVRGQTASSRTVQPREIPPRSATRSVRSRPARNTSRSVSSRDLRPVRRSPTTKAHAATISRTAAARTRRIATLRRSPVRPTTPSTRRTPSARSAVTTGKAGPRHTVRLRETHGNTVRRTRR